MSFVRSLWPNDDGGMLALPFLSATLSSLSSTTGAARLFFLRLFLSPLDVDGVVETRAFFASRSGDSGLSSTDSARFLEGVALDMVGADKRDGGGRDRDRCNSSCHSFSATFSLFGCSLKHTKSKYKYKAKIRQLIYKADIQMILHNSGGFLICE